MRKYGTNSPWASPARQARPVPGLAAHIDKLAIAYQAARHLAAILTWARR